MENPETVIEIIVGVVGFLGVVLSLRADRKVKVAEFIAQYNLIFLTTTEFIEVERQLEGCFDAYCRNHKNQKWTKKEKDNFESECDKIFQSANLKLGSDTLQKKYNSNGVITKNYQAIVNYLVYLESFATLITQKRVRIKNVDNLFGYRFFIAVNNPVVQKNELLQYSQYYKGIIKAYKSWIRYYKKHKAAEPMKEYALNKVFNTALKKYTEAEIKAYLAGKEEEEISFITSDKDVSKEIARKIEPFWKDIYDYENGNIFKRLKVFMKLLFLEKKETCNISPDFIKPFAATNLLNIRLYFEHEEYKKEFAEWKEQQKAKEELCSAAYM